MKQIYNTFTLTILMALLAVASPGIMNAGSPPEFTTERHAIALEMKYSLRHQLLDVWYPLALDTLDGGFLPNFNYKWEPGDRQDKLMVSMARHTWTTARAAMFFQDNKIFLHATTYGFQFIQDNMWDSDDGGFYSYVSRDGVPLKNDGRIIKRAYENAFAIYALTAYYRATQNASALELAKKAFYWLDRHSYDPVYAGYYQFLAKDGTPFQYGHGGVPPKDQNSSIHLLEAFTALYQVWPDSLLRERLHSLMFMIRDTIVTKQGFMNLFFQKDWTPYSLKDTVTPDKPFKSYLDHVSFSHDIETAYLLMEASDVLGLKHDSTTTRIAKKMVDHALRNGWDDTVGGLFDRGYYFKGQKTISIIDSTKEWWGQVEAMNTLLIMADKYPADELDYYGKFVTMWDYCKTYLIDHEYGGWFHGGLDKEPEKRKGTKGTNWQASYHSGRSLMNCISRLTKSEVVSKQQNRIRFHNQDVFLSGLNAAWIDFANDIGSDTVKFDGFAEMFKAVHVNGGNSIRLWLHTNGKYTPAFNDDGLVTDPGKHTIADLRKILDMAWEQEIGLILCLWSFDMLRTRFGKTVTDRAKMMLTDTVYTQAYIQKSLIPMVASLKDHPGIIAWEIFNEPEGMSKEYGWDFNQHVAMHDIQRFINLTSGAIHRTDPDALVTNGSWAFIAHTDIGGNHNYYTDDRLFAAGGDRDGFLDFYTVHYYDWAGVALSPFHHPFSHWKLDKPLVIAEFWMKDTLGKPYTDLYQLLYENGYAGALGWQWYDGMPHRERLLEAMKRTWERHQADVELIDTHR